MFDKKRILYEDNHIIVVNKKSGELVQKDSQGDDTSLEDEIKEFIKIRDDKPGNVYLGVVHRIDRPVSGAVLFAKSSKALARLNEMIKNREIKKIYWAITENRPEELEAKLTGYIVRDGKTNKSRLVKKESKDAKLATLSYTFLGGSAKYSLLEVNLETGRHHQIRCQLAKIGCPIRGDLKYGAPRSNSDGSISLHSRSLEFIHPVKNEPIKITAKTNPEDNLWSFFEDGLS